MSVSGPNGQQLLSRGKWCGSRGATLRGRGREAMSGVGYREELCLLLGQLKAMTGVCFCLKDQGPSESGNWYCYF